MINRAAKRHRRSHRHRTVVCGFSENSPGRWTLGNTPRGQKLTERKSVSRNKFVGRSDQSKQLVDGLLHNYDIVKTLKFRLAKKMQKEIRNKLSGRSLILREKTWRLKDFACHGSARCTFSPQNQKKKTRYSHPQRDARKFLFFFLQKKQQRIGWVVEEMRRFHCSFLLIDEMRSLLFRGSTGGYLGLRKRKTKTALAMKDRLDTEFGMFKFQIFPTYNTCNERHELHEKKPPFQKRRKWWSMKCEASSCFRAFHHLLGTQTEDDFNNPNIDIDIRISMKSTHQIHEVDPAYSWTIETTGYKINQNSLLFFSFTRILS